MLIWLSGPRSQLTEETFLTSLNSSLMNLIVAGHVSFGVMARVPQKYGLPWPKVEGPPPPSNVNILNCVVPGVMAPRSST